MVVELDVCMHQLCLGVRIRRAYVCHVLSAMGGAVAAGHDMSTPAKAKAVLERMEATIGLDQVLAVHLNDSVGALGSRKDRHAHIGDGTCGEACFKAVLRVPAWRGIPMVLETEKEGGPDGRSWDVVNLEALRSLAPGRRSSRSTTR